MTNAEANISEISQPDPLRVAMARVEAAEAINTDPSILSRVYAAEDALADDVRLLAKLDREKDLAIAQSKMKERQLKDCYERMQKQLMEDRAKVVDAFDGRIRIVNRGIEAHKASVEVLKRTAATPYLRAS